MKQNFLFCGNHETVENTAYMFIVSTSKASQVNPREWLTDAILYKRQGKRPKRVVTQLLETEKLQRNLTIL